MLLYCTITTIHSVLNRITPRDNNVIYSNSFSGGFVGLFLGYALLHVPELLFVAYTWIRKHVYGRSVLELKHLKSCLLYTSDAADE